MAKKMATHGFIKACEGLKSKIRTRYFVRDVDDELEVYSEQCFESSPKPLNKNYNYTSIQKSLTFSNALFLDSVMCQAKHDNWFTK